MGEQEILVKLGKKDIEEIRSMIDSNCWKALFYIFSFIHLQMKYLFYYGANLKKDLGNKCINIVIPKDHPPNQPFKISNSFRLENIEEHQKKWEIMDKRLKNFNNAIELCFSLSLIDDLQDKLNKFVLFRNQLGHINLNEDPPDDEKIKQYCRLGIDLMLKLDNQIKNAFFKNDSNLKK